MPETKEQEERNTDPKVGPVLHKSGGIQFHLDGRLRTLQVPTIGRLRKLKEAHHEVNDRVTTFRGEKQLEIEHMSDLLTRSQRVLNRLRERLDESTTEETDNTLLDEIAAARREVNQLADDLSTRSVVMVREAEEIGVDAALDWFELAFEEYGITGVDRDDLPAWCGRLGTVRDFVTHWMTYPSPRGV